jgi:transcriptional regulator with XRE-family HTH domain
MNVTDKKYHSYKEVCEAIGMTSSNLNRLRESTGENCPTVESIGRLCDVYKISASWLILEVGNLYADIEIMAAYQSLEKRVSATEDDVKRIEVSLGLKAKK